MIQLHTIIDYLDTLLDTASYSDASLNGLQVEAKNHELKRIAFAVDAGLSVIESAIKNKADLLVVHHGIFWNKLNPIKGVLREKIYALLSSGCSLYASHLPLDAHPEVGNNYTLGKILGLSKLQPFLDFNGKFIACSGSLDKPVTLNYFTERLATLDGAIDPLILDFGNDQVSKVAVVTGSGSIAIEEVYKQNLDLLISGEPKHEAYHAAKELGVNAIFAGHYATETVGPKALMNKLAEDLKIDTIFIHEGTGI
ncbi:MAG: Nif3-like dinuclear metal center hexameric protein [Bdellovibrionales bacterium]|nr:Nif3-like dinuclear metal center hexameric protein [Bdellovibrionales bacterium]